MSNIRGGNRHRKAKNNRNNQSSNRELRLKTQSESEYAFVTKMLGNNRVEVNSCDGKTRLGNICGKMRNKVFINVGDLVLLDLREFQDSKAEVVHKYHPDEVRQLRIQGHIAAHQIAGGSGGGNTTNLDDNKEEEIPFDFETI